MSDASADCITGCCLCAYAALESWCILHAFGSDVCCCGGPRGCCGSCCNSSFNEDDFDERMRKEQARQGINSTQPVDSQPAPLQGMSVSDDAKPASIVDS